MSFLLRMFQALFELPLQIFLSCIATIAIVMTDFWYDSMAVHRNLKTIGGILHGLPLFGGETPMLPLDT